MKKDVAMQMFRDRVMCVGIDGGFMGSCFLPFFSGFVAFSIASSVPLATSVKAFCSP